MLRQRVDGRGPRRLDGGEDPAAGGEDLEIVRAALTVTPASASDAVSFSSRTPTVMTSGRLALGDVPGLKSVASATGTPRSMSSRAGANSSCMRNHVVAGRSVATTG